MSKVATRDPTTGAGETDLATKNTSARGEVMWVIKRDLDWVGGFWQLDRRMLLTEMIFRTTYPEMMHAAFFMHPLRLRNVLIGWCLLRAAEGYSRRRARRVSTQSRLGI